MWWISSDYSASGWYSNNFKQIKAWSIRESIHLSNSYTFFFLSESKGILVQETVNGLQVLYHTVTQSSTLSLTPFHNLELPINHIRTGRTCKLHIGQEVNLWPFFCEATALTTVPPCYLLKIQIQKGKLSLLVIFCFIVKGSRSNASHGVLGCWSTRMTFFCKIRLKPP